MTPDRVAIGLGSNLGDREATLVAALASIHAMPMSAMVAVSRFHETQPVGPVAQGMFLNACAVVTTALSPSCFIQALQAIELAAGRTRLMEQRWGPRTLDLDVLLWGDLVIDVPGLRVPHPRMHERRFVLEPLAEVWPQDFVIPATRLTLREALAHARA